MVLPCASSPSWRVADSGRVEVASTAETGTAFTVESLYAAWESAQEKLAAATASVG